MPKLQAQLRLVTVNVRTLVDTSAEVTKTVGSRRVDLVALQECVTNVKVEKLRGGDFEYRLY